MKFFAICLLVAGLLFVANPSFAAADVVACDLFDEPTVSSMIGAKIKRHNPNRRKEMNAGIPNSDCTFIYERHTVRVNLSEYASSVDAARAYAEAVKTYATPNVTLTTESGLGDKAFWYRIATEQFGFTVLKGNRIVVLRMNFKDANAGSGLKERIRPKMQTAVSRL